MKRLFTLVFVVCFIQSYAQTTQQAKLSPFTKMLLRDMSKMETEQYIGKYVHRNIDQHIYLSGLILVNSAFNEADLQLLGVSVGTRAGKVWTVQVPLERVNDFIQVSGIDYIELDEPSVPLLDNARLYTHADSVHAGINLPMPYTGKDVVVGVVDAGYDFEHPLYFDTNGVNYRVKKVWMQKNNAGPNPAGYNYGTEMTDSLALWTQATDNGGSHGTHVSGICGGSGFGGLGTNRRFRGFAYDADMVLVCITPDKQQWIHTGVSDMIDGINYIFTYANSISKPAVVNLSWGSPLGPRDGTGLFSQAIDNLVGPGNIFVCSAGNNGGDSIHIQKTFTPTDTVVQTYLNIAPTPVGFMTWVDMWGDSGKTFCAEVALCNNGVLSSTGIVCLDDSTHDFYLTGTNGDSLWISLMTSTSEFNNKPRIFFDFDSHITADSIRITVTGTDGTINFWNTFVHNTSGYYGSFLKLSDPDAVDGDKNTTISDIASSKEAISVGAYASKINWVDVTGTPWSYSNYVAQQNLVPFSSKGPTIDGRVKPDICGPGLALGSGVSSMDSSYMTGGSNYMLVVKKYQSPSNNNIYPYAMLSGTSMSGPSVSGIVAMMLQVKPDLTPQEVKNIINQTAIQDNWTDSILPSNNWGHGKINAYGAVQEVVNLVIGVNTISEPTLNCSLYPNPNNGNFILNYEGEKPDQLSVDVYDVTGKKVQHQNWLVQSGYNYLTVDCSHFSAGSYVVKIYSDNGSNIVKMVIRD